MFSLSRIDSSVATDTRPNDDAAGGDVDGIKAILVVDDNVDGAELLAEMLRLAGHAVEVAHDGITALACIEQGRFDVAILDIGLPAMNGYELATHIRQRHGDHAPRLIAITGYGQSTDRERSVEVGFDRHLVKPVDPDAIYRAVDETDGATRGRP